MQGPGMGFVYVVCLFAVIAEVLQQFCMHGVCTLFASVLILTLHAAQHAHAASCLLQSVAIRLLNIERYTAS